MTQEEKAKAYDKALEIAKKNYGTAQDLCNDSQIDVECFKNTLTNIFPELKESEDEKIRKEIIAFLTYYHTGQGNSVKYDDGWIAWLERQKELTSDEEKQGKEDVLWCINQAKKHAKDENEMGTCWFAEKWLEKQGQTFTKKDADDSYLKGLCDAKQELEKQGEKKTTDKVELKFKVGDWVVNKLGDVWHIDSFDKKNYQVSNGKGDYNYFPIAKQDEMHLWNIGDAKEGDVICYETKDELRIFIYIGYGHTHYHCCYYNEHLTTVDSFFVIQKHLESYIHPATKEQRDLLFLKMEEAGYTWNPDEKKLKKIEHWSNEDEENFKGVTDALNFCNQEDINPYDIDPLYLASWLKSLKNRVQTTSKYTLPQREEGEPLIYYFEGCIAEISPLLRELFFEVVKEIKAKQWKPSDEQIEAIRLARSFVTDDFDDNPTLSEILVELEKQLKKIR